MDLPLAYLFLGPAGSGRRAILADLIAEGLGPDDRPVLLVAAGEKPAPEEVSRRLGGVTNLHVAAWRLEAGLVAAEIPEGATHVFFVSDGRANPVDQVEAFHTWLPTAGLALARIVTVVHCALASEHRELLRWFDACVHFSDVVLLNRREGVPQKWVSEFVARFHKDRLPCLVELVSHDAVGNPARVLAPEARRISMFFDEPGDWPAIEGDEEEDEEDEPTEVSAEDGGDLIGSADPYVERLPSGRRAKEIPDIARFLPAV